MASAVNFPGQFPRQTICFMHRSVPVKRSSMLAQKNQKMEQRRIYMNMQTLKKPFRKQRFNLARSSLAENDDMALNHLSAATVIKQLYTCINEKRLKEIEEYISDDCSFEECSFVSIIQGKKEIMQFYQLLTTGMGNNVKFCIEHVCEDDEFTAGVNWHLEWKKRRIPFTRGCSFYECSTDGDRLIIKNARIVIESPIKPGRLVLILLKNVTAIFDDYPNFAEWFLKSPHVIVQFLIKIYSKLFTPIVDRILASYIRVWNIMARVLALAINILFHISEKYFK